MNSRITGREVAKQFIIAIDLLLEWIDQKENSNSELTGKDVGKDSIETRLLTSPDVARILNVTKGAAYKLIQLEQIPIVRINRNVKVNPEDLEYFILRNLG